MRYLIVLIVLATLAVSSQAQVPTPANPPDATTGSLSVTGGNVTLDLKDASMRSVVDQLFKAAGKSYTLTQNAITWMDSLKPTVQLRVQNAPFDDALSAVLGSNYHYVVRNGNYKIMSGVEPREVHEDYLPSLQSPGQPAMAGGTPVGGPPTRAPYLGDVESRVITMDLPPMTVEEAYKTLDKEANATGLLGWQFTGSLGKTMMPGAKFRNYPFRMAVDMVVAAAGLTPPVGRDTQITTKRKSSFTSIFHYVKPNLQQIPMLGAYKGSDGVWRYTLVTVGNVYNSAGEFPYTELISLLLNTAGVDYSMGRSANTSATATSVKVVTVRLVDATLNEALDAILDPLNLSFKQKGKLFIIQDAPATPAPAPKPAPSKSSKAPAPGPIWKFPPGSHAPVLPPTKPDRGYKMIPLANR